MYTECTLSLVDPLPCRKDTDCSCYHWSVQKEVRYIPKSTVCTVNCLINQYHYLMYLQGMGYTKTQKTRNIPGMCLGYMARTLIVHYWDLWCLDHNSNTVSRQQNPDSIRAHTGNKQCLLAHRISVLGGISYRQFAE